MRGSIAVDNMTFVGLKIPRSNNQNVSFTDPDPFFDLSLNSAEAGYAVGAAHSDVVGSKHQLGLSKLFF